MVEKIIRPIVAGVATPVLVMAYDAENDKAVAASLTTPIPVLSMDFLLEVAAGNVEGYSSVSIIASNPSVGSSPQDVWDVGGTLVYPTAGETWEILSSDAADAAAGTGARVIKITYLDDNYVRRTENKTLNGVTPVIFDASNALRFINADVISVGSDRENAGLITVRVSGGGNSRGGILAGNNFSADSHYTVPAGRTSFLYFLMNNINKNEDVQVDFVATNGDDGIFRKGPPLHTYQSSIVLNLPIHSSAVEKTDVKLIATSSNPNGVASAVMQFVEIDN